MEKDKIPVSPQSSSRLQAANTTTGGVSKLYDIKVSLSDGSTIIAGQIEVPSGPTGPQGPTGPTGLTGPTGPIGNANVKTGTITISSRGTPTASPDIGGQPKSVQIWMPDGTLVIGTIKRTSTGFILTSNLTGEFIYSAVM